jgi:hypothetical protein
MPTASDLVTDLPADFETFGQAVATSMADLLGGTTGQVLSKASNTDMDFTWVAQDDSNAIQNAIVDAKGDLIAASAADTPARLAVGANGKVLVAESGQTLGMKWGYAYNLGVNLANSTDQSTNNSTEKILALDTEFWDTSGFHSNTTNNSRITIPTGLSGRFALTGFIVFPANATGSRYVAIRKNAGGYDYLQSGDGNGTFSTYLNYNIIYEASAGDYFEVVAFQNSGGSLNVLALSRAQMTYLGE